MHTKNVSAIVLFAMLGTGGCGHGSSASGQSNDESLGRVRERLVTSEPAPITTVLLQTRVRHGETSSDGTERFALPLVPDDETVLNALQKRARYVDKDGNAIPAVAKVERGMTPADSNLIVSPGAVLSTNSWYWLVVAIDQDLSIADPDMPSVSGQWSTHFFTGSAPHVIRVEVPAADKPLSAVTLTFSEQVDLTGIDATTAIVADGRKASGCVLRGTKCRADKNAWLSTMVDISVDIARLPAALAIHLPGGVAGAGRSVAASGAFTAQSDAQGGGLQLALTASDFSPAPGAGSLFWAERIAPPDSTR